MKTSETKEGIKKLVKELLILIIAITILYFAFTGGLRLLLNTDTPIMVVVSGSMRPTININDLIIIQGVDPTTLEVGDIIVFKNPNYPDQTCGSGHCIVHRIIEVESKDPPLFRTKGDANYAPDPFLVKGENIVGKVILIIPQVGIITRIFKPPYNYLTIIIIFTLFIILEARETFKQETEAAQQDTSGHTPKEEGEKETNET